MRCGRNFLIPLKEGDFIMRYKRMIHDKTIFLLIISMTMTMVFFILGVVFFLSVHDERKMTFHYQQEKEIVFVGNEEINRTPAKKEVEEVIENLCSTKNANISMEIDCNAGMAGKYQKVKIYLNENVKQIITKQIGEEQKAVGVKTEKRTIEADKIILATGGKSYPLTGSTGEGYKMAEEIGHTVTEIKPSLVPLETYEVEKELQGLSLKNVKIQLVDTSKKHIIYEDFGEMLFTHFGVSGPIILSSSAHLVRYKNINELFKQRKIILKIDLKPALTVEKLNDRILRDFEEEKNKQFKNSLNKLLPQKMINTVIKMSEINPQKQVNTITKQERMKLIEVLKGLKLEIKKFRPIEEAIITSGGIKIKEINPKTMESKKVKGLYFAGEIIDVDSYTGGFNLQIAYSTGYVAGKNQT